MVWSLKLARTHAQLSISCLSRVSVSVMAPGNPHCTSARIEAIGASRRTQPNCLLDSLTFRARPVLQVRVRRACLECPPFSPDEYALLAPPRLELQ